MGILDLDRSFAEAKQVAQQGEEAVGVEDQLHVQRHICRSVRKPESAASRGRADPVIPWQSKQSEFLEFGVILVQFPGPEMSLRACGLYPG